MTQVTASDLARALNVTRTRIGQYVLAGKLDGCFTGEGRARRFDLEKATAALGRNLHPGQMLGNGAETKKALAALKPDLPKAPEQAAPRSIQLPGDDAAEEPRNADRYELARIQKAEEEARKLRRQNAEAEGIFVLASEVERTTRRLMAQEIAEMEALLREGARRVADLMGLDFRVVRKILVDEWRTHRKRRMEALQARGEAVDLTPEEQAEDI